MCSRVWRGVAGDVHLALVVRPRPRAPRGRRRAAPSSRPRSACRRAAARACRAQRAVAGLDRALLDEVAVGDHAGHLDDVAQLDLAPGAARGGALQRARRGCRSPGAACRRPRRAGAPSARARPGPGGARAPAARSRSPSARASPARASTRPLISSVRLAISPAARSSSARAASATRCASDVAGLREHVHRDRLQLVAHALAGWRVTTAAAAAEQDSEDQQAGHRARSIISRPSRERTVKRGRRSGRTDVTRAPASSRRAHASAGGCNGTRFDIDLAGVCGSFAAQPSACSGGSNGGTNTRGGLCRAGRSVSAGGW